MGINQIFIIINGNNDDLFKENNSKIIISRDKKRYSKQNCTFLHTDYSLDDLIKAHQIIKSQMSPINEILIINNKIDLNMLSYQYDYKIIKDNYSILPNLFFFINLLIENFDKKLNIILSFETKSHFKIHTNIFNDSIISYLETFQKDLVSSHSIKIKKLN